MNTPETRAASDFPHSPWRLLAIMALKEAKELPETRGIACLCNYLAQAYRQGAQDQQSLERQRSGLAAAPNVLSDSQRDKETE